MPNHTLRTLVATGAVAVATGLAGGAARAAFPPLTAGTAVEFHHAAFDHYFITQDPAEIAALDTGRFSGWTRTGRGFAVFTAATTGTNPVCRFYIPPEHGDSHFFSASLAECADILGRIGTDPNYSGYVYESPNAFYAALPDAATGTCPANMVPVFRLWNQRADSNHRYTADVGIKAAMQAILADIRSGAFARAWVDEYQDGAPRFEARREAERTQPLEEVGARLRALMPFLDAVTVKPGD